LKVRLGGEEQRLPRREGENSEEKIGGGKWFSVGALKAPKSQEREGRRKLGAGHKTKSKA